MMPTFEVDDQLHAHPKIDVAGLEAMGLWVIAGSWCAAYLTDGFVPRGRALRLGDMSLWDRLVKAQLVEATDDGFQFHDWDHWNRTAAQVAEQRAKSTLKKQDQRARKRALSKCPQGTGRETKGGTDRGSPQGSPQGSPDAPRARVSQTQTQSQLRERPNVSPGDTGGDRPGDTEFGLTPPGTTPPKTKTVKTVLPKDWAPSAVHYQQAMKEGGRLSNWVDSEAQRMRDWAASRGERCVDWDARFRNWLRRGMNMMDSTPKIQPRSGRDWMATATIINGRSNDE